MIQLLYFGRYQDDLDATGETFASADNIASIQDLRTALAARGGPWQQTFGPDNPLLLAAVNQQMATADTAVQEGDEVAFFPPVTGG